jgi:hypothetical protein
VVDRSKADQVLLVPIKRRPLASWYVLFHQT